MEASFSGGTKFCVIPDDLWDPIGTGDGSGLILLINTCEDINSRSHIICINILNVLDETLDRILEWNIYS
jgi:hypothetical protein